MSVETTVAMRQWHCPSCDVWCFVDSRVGEPRCPACGQRGLVGFDLRPVDLCPDCEEDDEQTEGLGWVDQAEARANAATRGPWTAFEMDETDDGRLRKGPWWVQGPDGRVLFDGTRTTEADAELAAHAREDVPRLAAAVRKCAYVLRRVKGEPMRIQAIMRKHGFVIDNLDDRWQKLAFTIYTHLADVASKAERALAAVKEMGDE